MQVCIILLYLARKCPGPQSASEGDEGGIFVFKLLICSAKQSTTREFVIAIAGSGEEDDEGMNLARRASGDNNVFRDALTAVLEKLTRSDNDSSFD